MKSFNHAKFYETVEIEGREEKLASELCQRRVGGTTSLKGLGAWGERDRLTCDGLWERIRCLISLSEQTWRNSCGALASKTTGSPVTRPARGMSRY